MVGENKQKKIQRKHVRVIFSLLSIIVLTYVSVSLISGRPLGFAWFSNFSASRNAVNVADELFFDVGRDRVFADLDGAIAAVGALGIQSLDYAGNELLRDTFRMYSPAIRSINSRAIAFDIGGTSVRVFNADRVLSAVETDGAIISASLNRNGWFAVNTQESSGLRGVVTVYNNSGTAVFRVNLGSGYAFSSIISNDNRNLAVLNLTGEGSRVTLYQGLNQSELDSEFVFPDELILDLHFLSGGDLLAVSTNALIVLDRNGVSRELFDYSDKRLGGFIISDRDIILHLLDYGVGHSGRLVRLNDSGNVQAELEVNRELRSMSFDDGSFAVLWSDGVSLYDNNFNERLVPDEVLTAGVSRILSLGSGIALLTGDHSILAVRAQD